MFEFSIGCARTVITPDLGCELAGFAARQGTAASVHDDLFASVLVISTSDEVVVLVSLDVIGISQEFTDSVRARVSRSRAIAPHNIILCATHTHCGPVTIRHFFNTEQQLNHAYLRMLEDKVVKAIEDACDARQPGTISAGMVPVVGVAVNRRHDDGKPVDDYAGVLLVKDLQGVVTAILVNYACHPTALGPDTLDVTRDFPHYLARSLNLHLGAGVVPLYFNGAEGDLSVGHKIFLSAVGVNSDARTYQKAQQVGERLAEQVLKGLPTLLKEKPELAYHRIPLSIPLKSYDSVEIMRQVREAAEKALAQIDDAAPLGGPSIELLQKRRDLLFARIEEFYATTHAEQNETHLPIEIAVIRIGDTALLSLPGEPFVDLGIAIQSSSPFPRTMILGLANDYIGYIPTVAEASLSGYEVIASQLDHEASLLIEKTARNALQGAFDHVEFHSG